MSILAVSDNLITGQMGFINPDYYMAEGMLIQMAMELVKQLSVETYLAERHRCTSVTTNRRRPR